jgi:PAS domain S-box-containing protein
MLVADRPLPEILDALCRIAEDRAERPIRASVHLVLEGGRHLVTAAAPNLPGAFVAGVDGLEIRPDAATCPAAAARGEPVLTPRIAVDPGWAPLRHLPLGLGLQAAWCTPILSSRGEVLGTFASYFPEPREPAREERQLVEVLSAIAAIAIERHARPSADRQQFLAELDAATQPLDDASEVMAVTARMLAEHLEVDRCAYAEMEDERVFVVMGDYIRRGRSTVWRWDATGPALTRYMVEGRPFVVDDTEADPRIPRHNLPALRASQIRAGICAPTRKGGRLTAALVVYQATPRRWSRDEVDLVGAVVSRCWETLERVRVTRTLAESEARFRAMVEASPDCVMVIGADGTLLQINPAGLRMLEGGEASALGRSVDEVVVPEDRAAFRAFGERICRGERGTLHYDIVGQRGTRRSMETTAVPLRWGEGTAQLSVSRDITDRVAATRALEDHRARLDYAVQLSGVGFWYLDLPAEEFDWDPRVKEHFWMGSDQPPTVETMYARFHPDDRERVRRVAEAAVVDHTQFDIVYRTVDPDSGAIKWIRALGGATYTPDGTPIRFDGVTVDVTRERFNQEQLAGLLRREREHAHQLQQVAEAALQLHMSPSLDDLLRTITEQARAIIGAHQAVTSLTTGPDRGQMIHSVSLSDKYARWRGYDVPPTGAGIYCEVLRTNRPMRLTQAELEAHPAWRSFAGERDRHPPLRGWLAVPLVARTGGNLGLVQLSDKGEGDFTASDEAILFQLAQVAAVAIENVRLYDELRDHDRRKNEFLATLAHELRNPLGPIRTGLGILKVAGDGEQAARTRKMMERQVGHMVRMIDDLLDVSRITVGKVILRRERIDLRDVIDSALETSRPLIEAAGHDLVVHLPTDPLPIEGDPTRLAQVFGNLIHNAAKYTPPGGRIGLDVERDHSVVVRVSDTGIGIPPEMLPRVFDLFTQVGPSTDRAQGGLGIGLTLVRRLVEMHGGSVQAESMGDGAGSTFTVRLPLASGFVAAPDPHTEPPRAGPVRVLVVDDNVDGAESLAMLMALDGHETRTAHTGPDALAAAQRFHPDVVLLDIGLPGMSGYEVARHIREDLDLPQPLLIALTGWGSVDDRRRASEAGFDHHMVKPVDSAVLDRLLTERGPVRSPASP